MNNKHIFFDLLNIKTTFILTSLSLMTSSEFASLVSTCLKLMNPSPVDYFFSSLSSHCTC